jgi:hypothetical protein
LFKAPRLVVPSDDQRYPGFTQEEPGQLLPVLLARRLLAEVHGFSGKPLEQSKEVFLSHDIGRPLVSSLQLRE